MKKLIKNLSLICFILILTSLSVSAILVGDFESATVPYNFVGLNDTPSAYTGSGLYSVIVNAAEDALEFFDMRDFVDTYFFNTSRATTVLGDLTIDKRAATNKDATLVIQSGINLHSCINFTEGTSLGMQLCYDGSGTNRLVIKDQNGYEMLEIDRDSGDITFYNDTVFTTMDANSIVANDNITSPLYCDATACYDLSDINGTAVSGTKWITDNPYLYNDSDTVYFNTTKLEEDYYNQTELNTGQLDNRYFTETEIESGYIPYTGATANVDLNGHTLDADDITCTNGYLKSISTSSGINPWLESVNDLDVSTKFFTVRSGSSQSGNTWLQNTGNNDIIFKTTGKVGFGTINPSDKFDLFADNALDGLSITGDRPAIKLYDTAGGAVADFIMWNNGQGVVFEDVTATTPVHPNQFVMRLDNGHVGINNYAPQKMLDITDSTDSQLRLTHTANVDYANFWVNSAGDLTIAPSGADMDVTGTLDATENITSAKNVCDSVGCIGNVGLSHMFALATEIQTVAVIDTWYNITFNDTLGNAVGMSLTENKTIVIPNDGHYTITFGMGFQDASPSPNSDVAMRIVVNGVELAGSYIEYDISDKQDADTWLEHMTHAELNKDDELEMQYIASDTDVTITQDDTYATQGFVASGLIMETPE